MTFSTVCDEIMDERAAQVGRWGGAARDDLHSLEGWVALLTRHVGLATAESPGQRDGDTTARFRKQMIRVAAVAVAAVEAIDRRDCGSAGPKPEQRGKGF